MLKLKSQLQLLIGPFESFLHEPSSLSEEEKELTTTCRLRTVIYQSHCLHLRLCFAKYFHVLKKKLFHEKRGKRENSRRWTRKKLFRDRSSPGVHITASEMGYFCLFRDYLWRLCWAQLWGRNPIEEGDFYRFPSKY